MEDTNCGDECAFVKAGFCNKDKECPFYCESIWQVRRGTEIKTVKDCHPKKSMMETNNLHYRMGVLQEIQEDLRNRLDRIELTLNTLIEQSQQHLTFLRMKDELNESIRLNKENVVKQIQ
jgi:hypothetical protein